MVGMDGSCLLILFHLAGAFCIESFPSGFVHHQHTQAISQHSLWWGQDHSQVVCFCCAFHSCWWSLTLSHGRRVYTQEQLITPLILGMFPKRMNLCMVWEIWSSLGKQTNWLARLGHSFHHITHGWFVHSYCHQQLGKRPRCKEAQSDEDLFFHREIDSFWFYVEALTRQGLHCI